MLPIEILHLSKTKDRLPKADFIPTPACIKFNLTVTSARVKEKADDEFKALAEQTNSTANFI
jgi:hypothetical protein